MQRQVRGLQSGGICMEAIKDTEGILLVNHLINLRQHCLLNSPVNIGSVNDIYSYKKILLRTCYYSLKGDARSVKLS